MKKVWGLIILFAVTLCGAVFTSEDANAYYKDNCYAIQYQQFYSNGRGDINQNRVYSSKTLCYKNKKLVLNDRPSGTNGLSRPVFTDISNESVKLKYCKNGKTMWCPLQSETRVFKLSEYGGSFDKMVKDIDAFVAGLGNWSDYKKLALDKNDAKTETNPTGSSSGEDGDDDDNPIANVKENCANAGGAQSLGWIVCPVMSLLGDASDNIYAKYVEPSLRVDPKLFTSSDGNLQDAWELFRNIANIIISILLMIVILSQVTGVGIDNYGIKKILPKIIIAAVLINLSYFLCLLAVDISNILGNSFQAMFDGMSSGLDTAPIDIEGSELDTSSASGVLASVGVLGAVVALGGAMWTNPAIVMSLAVSALGVFISVMFLFVLLAAREAAVVVLTVISPVAMACYMLPNTKTYFDKWFKAMKALLVVYPIAGLLVGGGNYVARLLLTSGFAEAGFISAFTAMIAGIVPIFFIPTLLKNSLAAIGDIGSKISSLGRSASGWSTKRMRESGMYKNLDAAGLERQARIRGGLDKNGIPVSGRRRVLANVLSGGNRSRQRNALQYQKMVEDRGSLAAADEENFMLQTYADNELKRIRASGEINDEALMESKLATALRTNNKAGIMAYTDALSGNGESGRDAVGRAYNSAAGSGMSTEAAQTWANNIMDKHAADYKANARSTFETAKDIQGSKGANIHDTGSVSSGLLAMSAKPSTMVSMDDGEFDQTFAPGWEDAVRQRAAETIADQAREAHLRTNPGDEAGANAVRTTELARAMADPNVGADDVMAVRRNAWKALQQDPNMKGTRFQGLSNVARGFTPGPEDLVQVRINP